MVLRLLHRNDMAGQALRTMFTRLARQLGIFPPPGEQMVFPQWEDFPSHLRSKRFFLRNLLETGSLAGKNLIRGGFTTALSPNSAIHPLANYHPHTYLPPIHQVHDLLYQPDPSSPTIAWIDPQRHSSSPQLLLLLHSISPPQGPITLRAGQFWASNGPSGGMDKGSVWEIISIPTEYGRQGTIWARRWESHHPAPAPVEA